MRSSSTRARSGERRQGHVSLARSIWDLVLDRPEERLIFVGMIQRRGFFRPAEVTHALLSGACSTLGANPLCGAEISSGSTARSAGKCAACRLSGSAPLSRCGQKRVSRSLGRSPPNWSFEPPRPRRIRDRLVGIDARVPQSASATTVDILRSESFRLPVSDDFNSSSKRSLTSSP